MLTNPTWTPHPSNAVDNPLNSTESYPAQYTPQTTDWIGSNRNLCWTIVSDVLCKHTKACKAVNLTGFKCILAG